MAEATGCTGVNGMCRELLLRPPDPSRKNQPAPLPAQVAKATPAATAPPRPGEPPAPAAPAPHETRTASATAAGGATTAAATAATAAASRSPTFLSAAVAAAAAASGPGGAAAVQLITKARRRQGFKAVISGNHEKVREKHVRETCLRSCVKPATQSEACTGSSMVWGEWCVGCAPRVHVRPDVLQGHTWLVTVLQRLAVLPCLALPCSLNARTAPDRSCLGSRAHVAMLWLPAAVCGTLQATQRLATEQSVAPSCCPSRSLCSC